MQSSMTRVVRNRVTELLLGAFRSQAKREALLWLALFCERSTSGREGAEARADTEAAWTGRSQEGAGDPGAPQEAAASLGGLLEFRPRGAGAKPMAGAIELHGAGAWDVEVHPQLCRCLEATCDRVRRYATVLQQVAAQQRRLEEMQPLGRAVAEAGMCFDAGLFFEAHEHLEHEWVGLPPGPTRRWVQAIIQISVGLHHATRSSYDGAVNQLEKGLTKLADAETEILGLDCFRFRQEVAELRRQIVTRGRGRMRAARPDELPRMRIRL